MLSKMLFLVSFVVQAAAKKAVEAPPPSNPVVDYVMGIVTPTSDAAIGLASDFVGLVLAAPNFGVDVFVYCVGLARQAPDVVKNVYNGDDATLDKMTSFCTWAAGLIFVVTASLTALNLALATAVGVKDYFKGYLVLPTEILGNKLPGPILDVRNVIQKQVLDRIRNFSVGKWIVPLEGQSGAPSLAGATPVLASAVSACMILSCAPALHSLMKNGADKAAAEALAYTVGTALGIQYVISKL